MENAFLRARARRINRVDPAFEEFLLETARQIEEWLNDKPTYLKQFQDQIKTFGKKLDAYYAWVSSQWDAANKNRSFSDYNRGCSPKKGYIWDDNNGCWRQRDRKEIPHVTNWFPPNYYRLRTEGFSQQKSLYDTGFRLPDSRERLMCHYVLLAVVHDKMLKDPCYTRIYFDMGEEDVWFSVGSWANNTLWDYVYKPLQDEAPQLKCLVATAVSVVQKDLRTKTPTDVSSSAKKSPQKSAAKLTAIRKFIEWKNPGDAFFIVDENRIKFHHKNQRKDLRLKRDSKTERLLKMLIECSVASDIVKKMLCTKGTKPTNLKHRANKLLNEKLRKLGFTDVPDNTEFVRFNRSCNQYELTLPGFSSEDDFEQWCLEQDTVLVDDRWIKRLQDDEEDF